MGERAVAMSLWYKNQSSKKAIALTEVKLRL